MGNIIAGCVRSASVLQSKAKADPFSSALCNHCFAVAFIDMVRDQRVDELGMPDSDADPVDAFDSLQRDMVDILARKMPYPPAESSLNTTIQP